MKRPWIAGCVLLALSALGGRIDARAFVAVWLAAAWWAVGLVLGAFANAWMHRLTGGEWGERLMPATLSLSRRLPWLLLAFVPVLAGLRIVYPWTSGVDAQWLSGIARPAFLRAWLSEPFFLGRLAVYAFAWWLLSRPLTLASKGRSAAASLAHTALTSLAAVDLLMSLMPGWYSTAFGLVALSAQALGGAAMAIACSGTSLAPARREPATQHVPVSRDLGNLLLMWTLIWAYLAFMEFLVIWAENLPREIRWFVPRLQTGWAYVALALVLLQLAVPTVALLFRSVKDHPPRLRAVAWLMLATSALDALWLVLPSVDPHTLHGWWLAPLLFGGMTLVVLPKGFHGRA
jgi:hypothetical protein